jgi:hypothetical protein
MTKHHVSYALEGEDLIARILLRNITSGTYIDIGCGDPIEISNTYLFYLLGWRGVAIDGRNELKESWTKKRSEDCFVDELCSDSIQTVEYYRFVDETLNTIDANTAVRYKERYDSSKVKVEVRKTTTAESIWKNSFYRNVTPNLVSIDAEGFEIPIINGLITDDLRPDLLIIETKLFDFYNPIDHPVVARMLQLGYTPIAKTPLSCFFIDGASKIFSWLPPQMRSITK